MEPCPSCPGIKKKKQGTEVYVWYVIICEKKYVCKEYLQMDIQETSNSDSLWRRNLLAQEVR